MGQEQDITDPVYTWMLLQQYTENFPESDKEWRLTHLTRPQQSTIFKTSTYHN